MNEHFVCIKVDREERPDLDDIYMAATHGPEPRAGRLADDRLPDARTSSRSSPGRTSRPRTATGGPASRPSSGEIAELWDATAPRSTSVGRDSRAPPRSRPGQPRGDRRRGRAARPPSSNWPPASTRAYGGFGARARSSRLACASRSCCDTTGGRRRARPADGDRTLDGMAAGRDLRPDRRRLRPLLHRRAWLVPHFEKMLYDNALLARAYLEAFQVTGDAFYRAGRPRDPGLHPAGDDLARRRLLFRHRRRLGGRGGQVLRLDAGRGRGGPGTERAPTLRRCFDITEKGNWEGKSILRTPSARERWRPRSGLAAEPGRAWRRPGSGCTPRGAHAGPGAGRQGPRRVERHDAGGDGGGRAGPGRCRAT